jgi:hypothetical protein
VEVILASKHHVVHNFAPSLSLCFSFLFFSSFVLLYVITPKIIVLLQMGRYHRGTHCHIYTQAKLEWQLKRSDDGKASKE